MIAQGAKEKKETIGGTKCLHFVVLVPLNHVDASSSRVDLPVGQGRVTALPTVNLLIGIIMGLSSFTTTESSKQIIKLNSSR